MKRKNMGMCGKIGHKLTDPKYPENKVRQEYITVRGKSKKYWEIFGKYFNCGKMHKRVDGLDCLLNSNRAKEELLDKEKENDDLVLWTVNATDYKGMNKNKKSVSFVEYADILESENQHTELLPLIWETGMS